MLFREGQCGQKLTLIHMGLTYSLRSETFLITDALENYYLHFNIAFHRCWSDCRLTAEHTRTLLWYNTVQTPCFNLAIHISYLSLYSDARTVGRLSINVTQFSHH